MEEIDFNASMSHSYAFDPEKARSDPDWILVKKLYESNFLLNKKLDSYDKIPKIIHQIWLGSPLPEKFKNLQESWKKNHPKWEYHLWTDKDIPDLNLINQKLFDKTTNLGAKSDILRYELLYQFGGLYIDVDFKCLKPFDKLNESCNMYTGLGYYDKVLFYNGLIASSKSNPTVKIIIDKLNDHSHNTKLDDANKIMAMVGPEFFTNTVLEQVKKQELSGFVPFPITYFYPIPNNERQESEEVLDSYINAESYCAHYWSCSWVPKPSLIEKIIDKAKKMLK